MPAMGKVHMKGDEEFNVRECATAARLARFRGNMSDSDFAHLVSEVLRVSDIAEGRHSHIASAFGGGPTIHKADI